MADWDAFAEGFAGSYIASSQRTEAKKLDKVRMGAQAFLNEEAAYKKNSQRDASLMKQAKSLASTESSIPEDAHIWVYRQLVSGITPAAIIKDARSAGGTGFDVLPPPPKPESMTSLTEQTDSILESSDNLPELSTTSEEEIQADSNNPFTKYRNDIMDMVGHKGNDDYFDKVRAGYTSPEYSQKYSFTPGNTTKQEKYTPNQIAVNLAQQDARWNPKDPKNNAALVQEYVDATSKTGSDKTLTAAQMGVQLAQKSFGFDKLSPEEQAKVLGKYAGLVSRETGGGNTNTTFTNSNFTAKEIQMKQWMNSTNPEEVKQAKIWFDGERQIYMDALETTSSIGKDKKIEKGDPLRLTVADEDGRSLFVTAYMGENGNYKSLTGEEINPDNVLAVKSEDEAAEFNKMVTATQTITNEAVKIRTNTVNATKELYELDKLVKDNPQLLTLAAKGASVADSAKNELVAVARLVGQFGIEDEKQSSNSLIAKVAQQLDAGVKAGTFNKDMVEAYKVFSARLIRTVYATGRALGQQGNGFSNQDYKVILSSIVNANSYEAFSENLRGFGRTLQDQWSTGVAETAKKPGIQTLLMYPDGRRVLESSLSTPETYYGENGGGSSNANIYEWTQSKAASTSQNTLVGEATSKVTTQTPKEAVDAFNRGETVVITEELINAYPDFLAGKRVLR